MYTLKYKYTIREQEMSKMFKDNLLLYRKLAGLSQQDLAEAVGVSKGTISNYETGTRKPDIDMLEKLLGALNENLEVSIDYNRLMTEKKASKEILSYLSRDVSVSEPKIVKALTKVLKHM